MKPLGLILSLLSASFSLAIARCARHSTITRSCYEKATPQQFPELLELHKSLVEIPSVSDSEGAVGRFLQDYLAQRGYTVYAQPVEGGDGDRHNIFAYLGGSNRTQVLVTSHIDTRRGTELWGRGTVDAKGSVAAQIAAVESLRRGHGIAEEGGDVALLTAAAAWRRLTTSVSGDGRAVIFGEPTEGKLARGHKGILSVSLAAAGKAGHSGYPEPGANAIDTLVRGLASLQLAELPRSEEFGNTTLNVGVIQGGVADNVIPAQASASALVRLATDRVNDTIAIIERAVHEASPGVQTEFPYSQGPVPIDYDVEGFETVILNYGTDIPNLKGNHKRYLYGPGSIHVAHSDQEHLDVSDLEAAVQDYSTLISKVLTR
ncbi:uncharacterized protein PG986_012439 [Apiospora aurea]|uniref:Peptidase M20 dimerisation domain-containing protein n=1 Tax=Apiospora aurea TaxID=335848 RepID=A0ABR1Q156_9PEZI